jgi:hypothetical protein
MTNLTHNSFSMCLFQFSTCFEQPRAHHQENQLYQYNVWYVSLCVGDRLVCRSGRFLSDMHTRWSPTQSDTYQMLYWYFWFSWWWVRGCSKHVENWNKHIEKELCVRLVIYKNYTEMHSQQNVKNIIICYKNYILPSFSLKKKVSLWDHYAVCKCPPLQFLNNLIKCDAPGGLSQSCTF